MFGEGERALDTRNGKSRVEVLGLPLDQEE